MTLRTIPYDHMIGRHVEQPDSESIFKARYLGLCTDIVQRNNGTFVAVIENGNGPIYFRVDEIKIQV